MTEINSSKAAESTIDQLARKSRQLHALLKMCYGDAGESFRNLNDTLQDDHAWACSDLAEEIRDLAESL